MNRRDFLAQCALRNRGEEQMMKRGRLWVPV
jgi:hypothetical protein